MTERLLKPDEREYKNLEAAAKVMEALSRNGKNYEVSDTYLDYGQNWKWTTIFRGKRNEWMNNRFEIDCQVLCPRDWKKIVSATTMQELFDAIQETITDKYYSD